MANETKEQFKVIAKEYARMKLREKDERQFGTLLDGLSRLAPATECIPVGARP